MQERQGNLLVWDNNPPDAICVTTNGIIKNNGALVMGAGVAKLFRDNFPGLDFMLGKKVQAGGNHVYIGRYAVLNDNKKIALVSFPTKHHWKDSSDLSLIKQSCLELMLLTTEHDWNNVWLPKPGCANGGLSWRNQVKPLLSDLLDDRFTVISLKQTLNQRETQ